MSLKLSREYKRGKYHCTIDLLFDWFEISSMTTDNFCFYLQNRLIQTSQAGGQWYSDTSHFSIPCAQYFYAECRIDQNIPFTDSHFEVEGLDVKLELGFATEPEPAQVAAGVGVVDGRGHHFGRHLRFWTMRVER